MRKIIRTILIFLIFTFHSCEQNKEKNFIEKKGNILNEDIETENLEYSVYNQTLSLFGENILFNKTNNLEPFNNSFENFIFNRNFDIKDKSKLFERLKKERIDTANISLSKIEFLILPDSLTKKGDLKSKPLKFKRINYPYGTILINSKDSIRKLGFFIKYIELSRIIFNDNKTKAEFEIGIIRGKMNGHGYKLKCELKNGTWIIVEQKGIWVS